MGFEVLKVDSKTSARRGRLTTTHGVVETPVFMDVGARVGAENMYKYTGCDFVMVGRSAMGNPFVFEQINAYFKGIEYKK